MKHALTYMKAHGGYAAMRHMKAASIQSREIAKLLKDGEIEKIKPGLYRLADHPKDTPFRATFIDVCEAMPGGGGHLPAFRSRLSRADDLQSRRGLCGHPACGEAPADSIPADKTVLLPRTILFTRHH